MSFALTVIAKSVIILAAAAALSVLLRRASAATRHALWVLAIVAALLLPAAAAIAPSVQLPLWPDTDSTLRVGRATVTTSMVATGPAQKAPSLYSPTHVVPILWAAVFALLLAKFLAGVLGVRRLAKRAEAAENGIWDSLLARLLNEMGCGRPVRLLFSSSEISPMTWGLRRHVILLPSSARDWPLERTRLVLAHEIAHVKRNDGCIHLFVQLACSVY